MQECTNKELRAAREAANLARWQVAQEVGVSESTVRDWENGLTRPEPDDVHRLCKLYNVPHLWNQWMRSHYESCREEYPETPCYDHLTDALINVRHELSDVLGIQGQAERKAIVGASLGDYERELCEAQAAIAEVLTQIRKERKNG